MMKILLAVLALIVTALIGGVRNVRFWHKADIPITLSDVCFWG